MCLLASDIRRRKDDERRLTPLWPAGHLPLKGGDQICCERRYRRGAGPRATGGEERRAGVEPFSPLEGEMPGRAEGGISPHDHHSAASTIGAGAKSSGKCVMALITG